MKANLIKIKEGEYILVTLHKNLPHWFKMAFYVGNGYYKFASNTLSGGIKNIDEIHSLSLNNCQAIGRGYDLDALAENWVFTLNGHKWSNNDDTAGDNYGSFIAGAKTILEILSDKKFNEHDVRNAYFHGEKDSYVKGGQTKEMENEFIQSLQQTNWDVEIEMEPYHDGEFVNDDKTHSFKPKWRPKFDEDGCLILKLA